MKTVFRFSFFIILLLITTLAFGGITALADSFVPPEPFEIWSEDGRYVFRWNPNDDSRSHWTAQAGVYRDDVLIYSVENLPTTGESERSFYFSDDLRFMVFRPTVSQVAALGFFENGVLLRSYRIDELVRNMEVVTYSVSMASWENSSARVFDSDNNTLTIVTLDDITYVFDITTGEIIYDNAGNKPFIPPASESFGFFINDNPMPLWALTPEEQANMISYHTPIIIENGRDIFSEDFLNFEVLNIDILESEITFGNIYDFEIIPGSPQVEGFVLIQFEMLIGIIAVAVCINAVIIFVIYNRLKRRYTK